MPRKLAKANSRKTPTNIERNRGKRTGKETFFEVPNSLELLTAKMTEIEERLQRLELSSVTDVAELVFNNQKVAQANKPGRKPAYRHFELMARRDAIVEFLEMNWPEIKLALLRCKRARELSGVFRKARKPPSALAEPEFVQTPLRFLSQVREFSKSRWFSNNPRRLADALAGLPKLSWKRSFDICSSSPCIQLVHVRARRDFLQRKFAQRFRELLAARSASEVQAILARSRTDDPTYRFMADNPSHLLGWLRLGKAGVFE